MAPKVLRGIPTVSELLDSPALRQVAERLNHNVVVQRVRTLLDDLRSELSSAAAEGSLTDVGQLAERLARRILQTESTSLRPVINATGAVVHPDLGPPPLAEPAIEAMASLGHDYVNLRVSLASGRPASPAAAVEALLRELTGAEAALVANERASAVLLALNALGPGAEVIVSRGQLGQVGEGHALPELVQAAGAKLCEVGTTNKTQLADYEQAIQANTPAILRVEPCDFVVQGSTAGVTLEELASLARRRRVALIDELGDSAVIDSLGDGITHGPVVRECVAAGADLTIFGGDGLVGGPPCGVIVGRREAIQRLAGHPLARVLSVDKLRLAALAATLELHRDPTKAKLSIPILQLLTTSVDNLKNRAERLAPQMAVCQAIASAVAVAVATPLDCGPMPLRTQPTWCIALSPKTGDAKRLAAALRGATPAVIARLDVDRVLLDLRSVPPRHDQNLVAAVESLDDGTTTPQQD